MKNNKFILMSKLLKKRLVEDYKAEALNLLTTINLLALPRTNMQAELDSKMAILKTTKAMLSEITITNINNELKENERKRKKTSGHRKTEREVGTK